MKTSFVWLQHRATIENTKKNLFEDNNNKKLQCNSELNETSFTNVRITFVYLIPMLIDSMYSYCHKHTYETRINK